MEDINNPWLSEYREHVYGIGLISLNYNLFETTLRYILWNYTSVATTNFFFEKWSNEDRAAAIRHFAKEKEANPLVLEHIDHLMTFFSICAGNRNILMHSRRSFVGDKPSPETLKLEKRLRDRTGAHNVFHLDLPRIIEVSNDIVHGIAYCVAVDDYINYHRPLSLRTLESRTPVPALPDKPLLPRRLDPHRPVVDLQAGAS